MSVLGSVVRAGGLVGWWLIGSPGLGTRGWPGDGAGVGHSWSGCPGKAGPGLGHTFYVLIALWTL